MKLLFLGNSNDIPRHKGNPTRASAVATALEAATGQPVELVIKPIWPDELLPGRIERWMRDEHPDLVFFSVPGFWFLYESVPVRLKRRWGAPGRWLARLGFAAADRHLAATLEAIETCPCQAGCPSCVQSPKCGNLNDPLDKAGAIALLREILSPPAGQGRQRASRRGG